MARLGFFSLALLLVSSTWASAEAGDRTAPKQAPPKQANLIPNSDFSQGPADGLPSGWTQVNASKALAPRFALEERDGRNVLAAYGAGKPDCSGYLRTTFPIALGKTYLFRARFRISEDLNPQDNLLLQCFASTSDGIHEFRRLPDGTVEGAAKLHFPGEGTRTADVRIAFRLSAQGKAWFDEVSLTETTPIVPRLVKVGCTKGPPNLKLCEQLLDAAGAARCDLVLLSEYMQGERAEESLAGPSTRLMSDKARQHHMYVAGGIVRRDGQTGRVYNTAVLIDREGHVVGKYDKIHPYSPELNEQGITPGHGVPVFRTDFGKVGFMICYDSWFTDVAELLSLKGAEIVLFPSAGFYRSLMPARAADNGLRVVASSWNSGYGVWDTMGRNVLEPNADASCHPDIESQTFRDPREIPVAGTQLLTVTLDLNASGSPHYNGGTMMCAPGGRRNRREQLNHLEDEITRERSRWWTEEEDISTAAVSRVLKVTRSSADVSSALVDKPVESLSSSLSLRAEGGVYRPPVAPKTPR